MSLRWKLSESRVGGVVSGVVLLFTAFLAASVCAGTGSVEDVEQKLLEQAATNIEKHRMGSATLQFTHPDGAQFAPEQVEIEQTSHDFLVGCIAFDLVGRDIYKEDLFKKRFKELFNFAVLPFYWDSYERRPARPRWQEILEVVKWCKANDITAKGHPLVWTHRAGTPKWLSKYSLEVSEEMLKSRVIRIVDGYSGEVDMWDVVNEAVHTRTWRHTEKSNYISESVEDMADYVEKAFRWAHKGNPEAKLILNDFALIPDESARERFVALVKELQSRDVPISGLGLQAHEPRQEWFPPQQTWETLNDLSELGYPLHITEFTPQSSGKQITGGWREGKWTEKNQADFAEQLCRLAFGHPNVVSFNFWGLSDRRIWLEKGGLITEEYEPKPVYERVRKLFQEEWHTTLSLQHIPQNEAASFRGFYGDYRITVRTGDGTPHTFQRHLGQESENRWKFVIKE